ncbi:OmpA/MotB domain protein [Emticicia oligotrophica DSM 17448]|uniref:OmpA/MotB domain protein n=1 Tax=Emticicia oligotrophica (strain DSM 17448 / CIP 109782 / MTCC 6937 / GPTSA100-15) TaxID=929562 RepID=A0ABM5MYQ6_EMTOG|nr:OmpA family protein [Emticicia oligotrophica]AFK02306.1 OmpA/MotB domain protein [Emticicia oligotrophica DSM 17448]
MELLSLIKEQFTPNIISKISTFLDESDRNTSLAIDTALPTVLGGVMQKASTTQGLTDLLSIIRTGGYDGTLINNLNIVLSEIYSTITLASIGNGLLGSLFGEGLGDIFNVISKSSGITKTSASTLLGLVTPILVNVIGKHVIQQGITSSDLGSLMASQKESVLTALPAGIDKLINLDKLDDFKGKKRLSSNVSFENNNSKLTTWLPWLLLGGILLGALYYWKSCRNQENIQISSKLIIESNDSTQIDVVSSIKKTLSTGVMLNFGEQSIENELINFIEDQSKLVDKTTWFNFRALRFETGSALIDSTSMQEVTNIAEILKAFPNVELKIGGYTDNVGKEELNQKLSADRAFNVVKALVEQGIDSNRVVAEGYGSKYPVAANDTEEGRAQNRRIAVRVTKK